MLCCAAASGHASAPFKPKRRRFDEHHLCGLDHRCARRCSTSTMTACSTSEIVEPVSSELHAFVGFGGPRRRRIGRRDHLRWLAIGQTLRSVSASPISARCWIVMGRRASDNFAQYWVPTPSKRNPISAAIAQAIIAARVNDSRRERSFWMQRHGTKNRHSNARAPTRPKSKK